MNKEYNPFMEYSVHLQHAVSLILNGPLAGDVKACEGRGQTERKEEKKTNLNCSVIQLTLFKKESHDKSKTNKFP